MLILTQRLNDRVELDGPATVVVVSIQRGRVLLGFEADRTTTIVRQNAKVRERPHPMLCVQHGGSAACEASNAKHGFKCPRCEA